ncbi:MAG: PstS family phosphate ABC transporter substrate-binding protein [Lentisphaerae bacterium]|nr:PstS family phosphate ABC transporter substrate-binding protein [Lentisphaerota bacterium]
MKNKLFSAILIAGILVSSALSISADGKDSKIEGRISISGAWALYPMVVKWAEEFQKINPDVKIDISAGGAGKGIADALAGIVDFGMVSRDINPAEVEKGAWWVSVTKDAVVPVVNAKNPRINELLTQGVTREKLAGIWITEKTKKWEDAVKAEGSSSIHAYTRSDACGAGETWAKYLGKKQEDLTGTGVYGDPGLADAVKGDILGIGYNNINFVYDSKTKKQVEGIKILPIDLNGDGNIDEKESFYETLDQVVDAINRGVYPSPPARELHLVSKGKPANPVAVEFLKWILTDGQKFVPDSGYIMLPDEKLKKECEKLDAK